MVERPTSRIGRTLLEAAAGVTLLAGCSWPGAPPAPKPKPGHLIVHHLANNGHAGGQPIRYDTKRMVTPYDYTTLPTWSRTVLFTPGLRRYRVGSAWTVSLGYPARPPGPGLSLWLGPAKQITAVTGSFPPEWGSGPWLKNGQETLYLASPDTITPAMAKNTPPVVTRVKFWPANPILGHYHIIGTRNGWLDYAPNGPGLHFWMTRDGHLVAIRYWMPAAAGWAPWDDERPGQPRETRFGAVYTETIWIQVPPGYNQARLPGPNQKDRTKIIPRPRAG